MKKYFIFLLFGLGVSCAAAPTPIPDPLSSGAMLFSEKCGVCHSVPHPKRHTYKQWERLVPVMDMRMREKMNEPLLAKEKTMILEYLKRNSS